METYFENVKQWLDKAKEIFDERWKDSKAAPTESLGNFERIRALGAGAFGTVVLVQNKESKDYYAMKILNKQRIISTKQVAHTMNEKNVLYAISYPFVVSLKFHFKDTTNLYLLMDFINGGEMFNHLRKLGRFSESHSRFYAAQVILAFEYLHYMDLVYRDLKPENILIDNKGYLKVTDFGFCKRIRGRTWTLCGTPEYLAPEMILSKGYTTSVDWWTLGILIFEMAAGYPPFYDPQPVLIYEKILTGKYRPPTHFSNDIKDLLTHLIQLDLTKRYGNLKNGVNDLKAHKWFAQTDWDRVFQRKIDPPLLPRTKSPGDASNFVPMSDDSPKIEETDKYSKEFANF